jgi:GntR family transcriptional regulator
MRPGTAFPSEGDLAREIGVSTGTVRKALQLMEEDGLVVRRQGRGTFVSDPGSAERSARFVRLHGGNGACIRGQVTSVEITRAPATERERARLRLGADAQVHRIRRIRHYEGNPFQVEDATLPADLFPRLDERSRVSDHIGVLAREHGILLGGCREHVSTAVPPPSVASALRLEAEAMVVVLDRVISAYDNGPPVEWRLAHTHLPGSYYLAEIG